MRHSGPKSALSLFVGLPLEPGWLVALEVAALPRGLQLGGLSVSSRCTLLLLEPNLKRMMKIKMRSEWEIKLKE